ncbi:MAG: type II toxin-antitoxin system VapC family toxin [Legionellaceae bacterium]|nr:type II toxin-antitoxin system VapC family toxin [Legionellaceae bacterium]
MIILDTIIISELMKAIPDQHVVTWLDQQDPMTLFSTSITIAEIYYGIAVLPTGKRKDYLERAFDNLLIDAFKYRILTFDDPAAHICGHLMGERKQSGHPLSILNGQIAAITKTNKMSLATRNTRDFMGCELNLIHPFET